MNSKIKLIKKWVRYNAIGTMGVCVQLILLFLLTRIFNLNYLFATLVAVQLAIIHNFFWHQRWTWKESVSKTRKDSLKRFVKFNSSTGMLSIVGNVGVTAALVQLVHLPLLICNLAAIGACNLANFLFAHNFVFHRVENA